VQGDVTGLVEPAMVVEELRPASVVAHVEQACGRAAEALALAPESFGGVLSSHPAIQREILLVQECT